ncbi:MAG TPA: hypothetical protein VLB76_21180 [Thermoanaerobaculia bacterium]|nr:hypothetical protein [Thermoanaerobaculia bacterium]
MPTVRKLAVLLFLAALLAAPWAASAAGPRVERHSRSAKTEPVSKALNHAWSSLASLWVKTGCHIDPDGRCAPAPATVNRADTGCNIDPNGRCGL